MLMVIGLDIFMRSNKVMRERDITKLFLETLLEWDWEQGEHLSEMVRMLKVLLEEKDFLGDEEYDIN